MQLASQNLKLASGYINLHIAIASYTNLIGQYPTKVNTDIYYIATYLYSEA